MQNLIYPLKQKERRKGMDFFDTVAGHRFTEGTVPALTSAVNKLCDVIENLTDKLVKLEKEVQELKDDKDDFDIDR